jgi:uncharacterized protein (DUF433 family)
MSDNLEISADGLGIRGIERTPGVCGGSACIAGTRIPVWLLEDARRTDFNDAEILESYPSLTKSDLLNAWAYVAAHRQEIEDELRQRDEAFNVQ